MNAAFDFTLLNSPWSAKRFLNAVQSWQMALSPESWPCHLLNNHDVSRSASRYGWGESDERLKVAAAFLLTQRGTPFLYYGEEIGMRNIRLERNKILDPVGKRYWPIFTGWEVCRSPMQWEDTSNAGFSTAKPWLPVHSNYKQRNVTAQSGDPESLLNFYRKLIALRRNYSALRQGLFLPLTYDPRWVLGYLRQDTNQTILVALNFHRVPLRLVLGTRLATRNWRVLLSNYREEGTRFSSTYLPLAGSEVCILEMI
jgi:alpha-glucosidase